jgi:pyruvate dehydrogenase E2 component (dihydrolipoamide acetyltransferase)
MDILMPQLGETVAEGKITVWHKAVGEVVCAGDSLFEIETDKTSMDVPTTVAGVIAEIRVSAGVTVPVGAVVAVIADTRQEADSVVARGLAAPAANAKAAPIVEDPFNPVRTPTRNYGPAMRPNGIKVTPVARRLAIQLGVDLDKVVGTAPHSRIVAKDVEAAAMSASMPGGVTSVPLGAGPSAEQIKAVFEGTPFTEVPLDGMRRAIARRLLESKQTIPHFYLSMDIMVDRLSTARGELNAQAGGAFKLSINDFVIKALGLALQRVPQANAVWATDRILQFQRSDVGVAVAVEGGLFTPVLRGVELKSMSSISNEMKTLAERARAKLLKPADYQGGAISISNLGMYGVRTFSAIVNPPQASILAVGAVERRPVEAADGSIRFGSFLNVTLSCDHRVIDGARGAQLLSAFKALMETPLLLFA